ncbi:MAG: hypothetical protein WC809_00120 [Sinimarinibacterium sp.]|jgi:hypothetical protein
MGSRLPVTARKLLRNALIAWLCLSVPSAALAGILAMGFVAPAAQGASEATAHEHQHGAAAEPAHEHALAAGEASAQAHDDAMAKASCHCVGQGCGAGGAGFPPPSACTIPRLMTDSALRPNFVAPAFVRAHDSDLLRPPILG